MSDYHILNTGINKGVVTDLCKYIITTIILILLMCGTASAWLSGYDYRMEITVNNGGASPLTYYQFNFTNDTNVLVAAGHMQASGADCRITDSSDNLISFWNETAFNVAGTKIWANGTLTVGDNTFYMYYGKADAYSITSGINTFIFHDTDFNSLSTEVIRYPANPVLNYNTSLPFKDKMVRSPNVLYDEDENIWKMWYMGGNDTGNYIPCICHATSPNGINWTDYVNNPVLEMNASIWWETGGPRAPSVIKINSSMYYMYYSARDGTYGIDPCTLEWINLATSSDGTNWTRSANNPIISNSTSNPNSLTYTNNIAEPTVRYYNGTWYMLHSLQPDTGWKQALSMSSDHDKNWYIEKWTVDKTTECPNEAGHTPSILCIKNGTNPALVNGKFWQVHSCWGGTTNMKLKYRSSIDMKNWTDEGTLLAPSQNGTDWDQEETHFGDMLLDENDTMWLYYTGVNTSSNKRWQIGLAQAEHFSDFTNPKWKTDSGYTLSQESSIVNSAPYSLKGISDNASWLYGWGDFPNQTDTFIIEWSGASANNTTTQQFGISKISPPDRTNSMAGYWHADEYISSFNGTQAIWTDNYIANTWYKFKLIIYTTSDVFDVYVDDANTPVLTGGTTWGSFSNIASSFYLRGDNAHAQYIDDIFIRKYTSPEPVASVGAEEDTSSDIVLAANQHGMLRKDVDAAQNFGTIAAGIDHDRCYTWWDSTNDRWESYRVGYSYNSAKSVPEHDSYFVLMDGTGTTISCNVASAETIAIPAGYYATYLRESTNKTLSAIKTDMGGNVDDLWAFNSTAGAWTDTGAYSVQPNQGLMVNSSTGFSWDGAVS